MERAVDDIVPVVAESGQRCRVNGAVLGELEVLEDSAGLVSYVLGLRR